MPPEATPMVEVPTIVPEELAKRSWEVRPARVVDPMFEMEKSVVVAAPFEDEPIWKRVVGLVMPVVVETKRERPAKALEVVPIPTAPPYCARRVVEAELSVVKYAVEDA